MNSLDVRPDEEATRRRLFDAPSVSVVMPAYNAERWIARAVKSVLSQTLSQWELIVINDGSTDGTEDVVRGFDDPRIRVISQKNGGAAHARNVGIRDASGRYIALLDADDWYEPPHLERTVAFLDEHPECSLVGTNYHFVTYKGQTTVGCKPKEIRGQPGDGPIPDYFRATMRNRCYPITCCAVFRRELVPEFGDFDASLPSDEDHDFWTRWAMKSRFGYIDEPLSYYLVDTPGSNRKDLESSVRARVRSWRKLSAMEPAETPFVRSYARYRSFRLFRLTALAVAVGHIDEAREISRFWPSSPTHPHWWFGKLLAALPGFCLRFIHAVVGRTDFVKFRQTRPAPASDDTQ